MRFARIIVALAMGVTGCLAGCEVAAPYASCPLDKEVTDKGICNGTSETTSCVVRKHPQCDQDICLSYYGTDPVCTKACTSAADCPDESGQTEKPICWPFAPADATTGKPAEMYCVPSSRQDKIPK